MTTETMETTSSSNGLGAMDGGMKVSLLMAIPPGYATPVWPPSGIALAALLLFGNRVWVGVWLGAALINVTVQGSPFIAGAIATGNTLEAIAAATLVRPVMGRHWRFQTGEDVVRFIVSCALCAGIAAAVGVGTLEISGAIDSSAAVANALTWWQGDASGMIIVAPLLLSWSTPLVVRWPTAKIVEGVLLVLLLAMTTVVIFGGTGADWTSVTLAFLALPFVVWAAVRFSQREVTTAVAIVCAIAVWYAVRGHYPFGADSPVAALLFLLAYTSTLVMTGLILCAVIGERERVMAQLETLNEKLSQRVDDRTQELETLNRALREEIAERGEREEVLRQSEERFRLLVDGVKDYALFRLDPAGNVASWNTGAQNIYGYASAEIVGTHFSRLFTAEDIARDWPAYELATARAGGRYEEEGWRLKKDGSAFRANTIVSALHDSEGALIGFAKVTRDLTVPRRVEALQENQRQMNEFLAMLSHELRNPLAAIVNALDLMRHNPALERSEARGIVERQTAHLAHIVDDLLDVSRITRGKIELRKEPLWFNDAVRHALDSCQPLLTARGHAVDVRTSSEDLWVDADPTRLHQVILNLLTNAAKYTPRGGRIAIEVEREGHEVVLRVRDNGIGIAPTFLPNVFDLFTQGDRSLDRTASGLGIGLTIVKRMVEMHGGSVEAHSAGLGQGSEFVIRLPLASAGAAKKRAASERRPVTSGGRRVLIVDDNRDFATSLAALLEEFGHETFVAHDGEAGVALAAERLPDVVLLDIGLPRMDGYEVARRLRASPALGGVTLVALSGYSQEEDKRLGREAGFDHYLVKPIDAAELVNILDALPVGA